MRRQLLITILTLLTIHVRAQNWIGNQNFLERYNQSDVVVFGLIKNIDTLRTDSAQPLPGFKMPLKCLQLAEPVTIKGGLISNKIYYTDIFNGCGYAPVLAENILNRKTLIFARIKNDSLFQMESMNESVAEIAEALLKFEQIRDKLSSAAFTQWCFESLQNDALFDLLNHNINYNEQPLATWQDSIRFSYTQRYWIYDHFKADKEFINYEGIIKLVVKYKDKELKDILKQYIVSLRNEPYSEIDDLMSFFSQLSENKELDKLINQFNKDWREKKRIKIIEKFISRI